jgi:hypothetical protein
MQASSKQGSGDEFIAASIAAWTKCISILHVLGGNSSNAVGDSEIWQTEITMSQYLIVGGAVCDVVCAGRSYDFMVKQSGAWKVVWRLSIYAKE